MIPRSNFVVFEGVDGSGKSTQVERVTQLLRREGVLVMATREPGGCDFAESLRSLILDQDKLDPWAEAMVMAASRIEHCRTTIRPALARGEMVISDRYLGSSLVYQGIVNGIDVEEIYKLNQLSDEVIDPDLVILLDLENPRRISDQSTFEKRGEAFWFAVRDGYRELAKRFGWFTIDAEMELADITEAIIGRILEKAGSKG
ncbi:MAG: dTMP kinase [Acidimicrobiaceae bacterium]|nr:dTMP kinase [Acidimicrobiaceae bacterium]